MGEWWRQMVGRDPKSQRPLSKCSVGHQRGLFLAFTKIVRAETVFPVRCALRIFFRKTLPFSNKKNAFKSERNLWIACNVFSLFLLSFPLFVRKPEQGCQLSKRNLFLPSRSLIWQTHSFYFSNFLQICTKYWLIRSNEIQFLSYSNEILFVYTILLVWIFEHVRWIWTCAMDL